MKGERILVLYFNPMLMWSQSFLRGLVAPLLVLAMESIIAYSLSRKILNHRMWYHRQVWPSSSFAQLNPKTIKTQKLFGFLSYKKNFVWLLTHKRSFLIQRWWNINWPYKCSNLINTFCTLYNHKISCLEEFIRFGDQKSISINVIGWKLIQDWKIYIKP